jgi:hypothetical protein
MKLLGDIGSCITMRKEKKFLSFDEMLGMLVEQVGEELHAARARGKKAGITYPDYDSVEQFTACFLPVFGVVRPFIRMKSEVLFLFFVP